MRTFYCLKTYSRISALSFPLADAAIEEMIARGRRVRCLWVFVSESAPCSTMQGILWELQRKVRQFHQSTETFWLHNGSLVNRQLVEFSNWKPPMPLPWHKHTRSHPFRLSPFVLFAHNQSESLCISYLRRIVKWCSINVQRKYYITGWIVNVIQHLIYFQVW